MFVIPQAVSLELALLPPKVDWKPYRVWVEGNDLLVEGTVVKPRQCGYEEPIARTASEPYRWFAVESDSPVKGKVWPAGPEPNAFGPWRILGAGQYTVDVYQSHWCHRLWPLTVYLGRISKEGAVNGHP